VIRLNQHAKTASLVSQYGSSEGFESEYMGDTQPLADGGTFVGWGSERYLSEYDSSGKLRYEGIMPEPDRSYRAQLEPWEGMPDTKPAAAARRDGSATKVYASWNGATMLASWRVLGASSPGGSMRVLATAPRSGFETSISVPAGYASFEVVALDAKGHRLSTSSAFSAS
jgi:hypothetical protein